MSSGSQEQPIWSDEFNSTTINYSNGTTGMWLASGDEGGTGGFKDPPALDYCLPANLLTSKGIAYIQNGAMVQSPMRKDGTVSGVPSECTWYSAYLVADDRLGYAKIFGYWEFRSRFPNPCLGMFPAHWLFRARTTASNKANSELDLLEIFGNPAGKPWESGWHHVYGSEEGHIGDWLDDTTQWHRYGIEKKPGQINIYFDGELRATRNDTWFDDVYMVPRINYGMDPNWNANIQSKPTNPAVGFRPRMEVDYIRYFAARPATMATGSDDPLGTVSGGGGTVAPKLSTLQDDFASALDTTKWASNGATAASGVVTIGTANFSSLSSVGSYDATNSTASVQLVQKAVGGQTNFVLNGGTADPSLRFIVDANGDGKLRAGVYVDFIDNAVAYDSTALTYNAAVHKYLRFRDSNGTTHFEWSTTGQDGSWTQIRETATPAYMATVQVFLSADGTPTTPAKFDNFNIVPAGTVPIPTTPYIGMYRKSGGALKPVGGAGNAISAVDADSTTKGLVQLAGAFGGTATNPTALGFASQAALIEAVQDVVAALIVPGTNVTLAYDDAAGTLTVAAAGGVFTQPATDKAAIELKAIAGAFQPLLRMRNSDNNEKFTVSPDGMIQADGVALADPTAAGAVGGVYFGQKDGNRRVIFSDGTAANCIQLDQNNGTLRIIIGGTVRATLTPNQLVSNVGEVRRTRTVTASTTLAVTDRQVFVNAAGATTQTLPSAATAGAGAVITVKNRGAGAVTVAASAGTVETTSLAANAKATFVSDGTNWYDG